MPAREVLSWRRSLVFSLEPASEGNILEEVEMVLLTVQRARWTEVRRRGEQGAGAGAAESLVSVDGKLELPSSNFKFGGNHDQRRGNTIY